MDPTANESAPELPLELPTPENAEAPSEELIVPDEAAGAEPTLEEASNSESPGATTPRDELTALAELAAKGRLSATDEERAARALQACLLDGRSGVAFAVELLPKFVWIVAVNGVTAAWSELTAGFRTQLFAGLAKDESDAARRLRLSLARGIFKLDPASAVKLASSVAKELRDKTTGALAPKDAQMVANVFVGRAKPWLVVLPLAELKPSDAEALVHCALLTVFNLPHPPLTQLAVLRWAAESGRLAKLHAATLEAVVTGVGRWPQKWQGALRREVADLPEEIANALTIEEPAPTEPPVETEAPAGEIEELPLSEEVPADPAEATSDAPPAPARQYPVYVSRTVAPRESGSAESTPPPPARTPEIREPREPREGRDRREPREQREPRAGGPGASFNLQDALRQIDAYVGSLRAELKAAQARPKERDEDRRSPRRAERVGTIIQGEPTLEELARLNHQLEARILELQHRLDEGTSDAEDRAASSGAISGEPVTDPDASLRALLALKMQEDYEDFLALEKEAIDVVVQQHYRTLLRHIFDVLTHEGVAFTKPAH